MWRNSGKCGASGYRGKNTGGFLSMFSLFNRTTDATAGFVAELPANVIIDATTSSGEVSVDGITGGVTARTVSGEIKAVNVGGKVSLQTTNGDLTFAAEPGATVDAIALSTTNGDIHAALPAESEGLFDLSTVNGDVRSDFPLERTSSGPVGQHLKGQIGGSDRKVRLRAVNGSVVVTRAGSSGSH